MLSVHAGVPPLGGPKTLDPSIVPLEYTGTTATHTMLTLEKKKAG